MNNERHKSIINNELSSSLEDYLEAIYRICRVKSMAHATAIAERLHVGKSSVSWALNQLSQKGLINYNPYEAITLTEEGKALAEQLHSRHEAIKGFLTEILAVAETTAAENACRLEHVLDPEVIEKMLDFRAGYAAKADTPARDDAVPAEAPAPEPQERETAGDIPKTSKQRDREILRRLREVLAESGHPLTGEEITVAEAFMENEKHQSLEYIYETARRRNPKVTYKCTQQTLEILTEHKIARSFTFRGQPLYEHFHPESHHDHIFCVKCGAIIEFFDPRLERLQQENVRRCHFRLLHHHHNIYGVCRECIRRESLTRTLEECMAGEMVEIARITAGKETQTRLTAMGLGVGSTIHVLSEQEKGKPVLVMAGESRLMVDAETAEKIKIVAVDHSRGHRPRRHRHRHSIDRV